MNITELIDRLEQLKNENPNLHVYVLINGKRENISVNHTTDSDCYPEDVTICPI